MYLETVNVGIPGRKNLGLETGLQVANAKRPSATVRARVYFSNPSAFST
jgi:hypothetical protein